MRIEFILSFSKCKPLVLEKNIENALEGKRSSTFSLCDKCRTHAPGTKTPEKSLNYVKTHIESFPVMDTHYTRKYTKIIYCK